LVKKSRFEKNTSTIPPAIEFFVLKFVFGIAVFLPLGIAIFAEIIIMRNSIFKTCLRHSEFLIVFL